MSLVSQVDLAARTLIHLVIPHLVIQVLTGFPRAPKWRVPTPIKKTAISRIPRRTMTNGSRFPCANAPVEIDKGERIVLEWPHIATRILRSVNP